MNTPLTGISSFTQMLLEKADPDDPRTELLGKIEQQTFRAAKIVNSLLNLSRPSGGEMQEIDLNAVITDVVSEHNGLGYSGTNSGGNLLIVNSVFRNNRAGIVPNSGSYELCYPERDTTIVGNSVYSNNQPDTPAIDVEQLKKWKHQGKDLLLVDCRPFEEFNQASLPGSINCPGMELVTRVPGLVRSPDTVVVVHCAGRTRGIIGAQTLINANVVPHVVTLTNGMAGWILNGGELSHGNIQIAAKADPRVLGKTRSRVSKLAHDAGLKVIDLKQLEQLKKQAHRSLFLFDVRTPEEFQTAHLPGFRLAPGGQLIQSLDAFVGTRGSRIVLCDDDGVRARMTGYWLKQMGWSEIYVLEDPLMASLWMSGTHTLRKPTELDKPAINVPTIQASVLQAQMAAGETVVIDLSDSLKFGRSHIPGAWFGVRARLNEALIQIPPHRVVVLTSGNGDFAAVAWAEAQALSKVPVVVLSGGNQAWAQAGFPMASGRDRMTTLNDDVWYSPLERPDPVAAIHAYLSWEIGLNDHLELERGVRFQRPIPPI